MLGFDKITEIALETITETGTRLWLPTVIVMKSMDNIDLLSFNTKVSKRLFNDKLAKNVIMNVTDSDDISWDWLKYTMNIQDILDENRCPEYGDLPADNLTEYEPNNESIDTSSFTEYTPEVNTDG